MSSVPTRSSSGVDEQVDERVEDEATDVFDRVVAGLDGSVEALEAARQGCLLAPSRPVALVFGADVLREAVAAREVPALAHLMRSDGHDVLADAADRLRAQGLGERITTAVEEGHVPDVLSFSVGGDARALLTLGTRWAARAETGSPETAGPFYRERVVIDSIRAVECSALVARRLAAPDSFPASVAVGVDGSQVAADAHAVAAAIAGRSGADLRVVVALGGRGADLDALHNGPRHVGIDVLDRRDPVDALLAAAQDVDLLVVGNRGLHGLRSLGSVSERLVSRSPCSVLVVRRP